MKLGNKNAQFNLKQRIKKEDCIITKAPPQNNNEQILVA